MKLTKFTKKMNNLFKDIANVRMDISVYGESTILEATVKEEFFDSFKNKPYSQSKMIAVINLDKRFGLGESNFDNVPEQIRTAVFETVIEFVETPVSKR